jgi:hypothetical protein
MGKFASFGWTGASGQQIGFAQEYPADKYDAFTSDEVHAQNYNPNTPNTYAQPGMISDIPVVLQDQTDLIDYGNGMNGWILDDLNMPAFDVDMGTKGHDMPMGAAKQRYHPDPSHAVDIFQIAVPANHGIDFYGQTLEMDELHAWKDDSYKPITTKAFPGQARYDTENWPTPFDSTGPAPLLNVPRLTERIPMRRLVEDDRPTYRMLATPGQNINPSGSVYTPTYASNSVLHNVKPLPAMSRTPVQPWATDELSSPTDQTYSDSDVFSGMSLQ